MPASSAGAVCMPTLSIPAGAWRSPTSSRQRCWGQGYASELTRACTTFADHALGRRDIHAFAHPDNLGSQRVLEKAGFTVLRFVPEMDRLLYRRARPA